MEGYAPIEFESEQATLRGRLYLPGSNVEGRHPVVIMANGYSATIEGMAADRYAEHFQDAGFAVLLYDHRNLGISDGEPRQRICRWTQARGYRDALEFAAQHPALDPQRIALWGDSMSADVAMVVAAMEERVKAVVAQVPACGRDLPPADPDGKFFRKLKETYRNGNFQREPRMIKGPMPVVSFDQNSIPSLLQPLTAFRWFMEYGGRFNTGWVNHATYVEPDVPVKFSALLCAPYIKAALLMMVAHNDEMPGANPVVARRAFELAPEPKKWIDIEGGHFGIVHHPSALFDLATQAQTRFLQEYLLG